MTIRRVTSRELCEWLHPYVPEGDAPYPAAPAVGVVAARELAGVVLGADVGDRGPAEVVQALKDAGLWDEYERRCADWFSDRKSHR